MCIPLYLSNVRGIARIARVLRGRMLGDVMLAGCAGVKLNSITYLCFIVHQFSEVISNQRLPFRLTY